MDESELFCAMAAFADANRHNTMRRVLADIQASGEPLSEDVIDKIDDAVMDDVGSFIARKEDEIAASAPGMEYIRILKKSLIEEDLLGSILGIEVKGGCNEETVGEADPRGYRYGEYNVSLGDICHALVLQKDFGPADFGFFLSLALVVDLFSKKTVPGMEDLTVRERERALGVGYAAVDDLFHLRMLDGERKMVIFHLKNAIAHGRIASMGSQIVIENVYEEDGVREVFEGMTSRGCLTNDIISSMLIIWTDTGGSKYRPFRTKIKELLGRSRTMTKDELVENGMSVLSLGYQSYHDRYIDRVDRLLRRYTTCKDYIGMTKGIRQDDDGHAEGRIPDADNMSHALSHNAVMREGYFECDGRLISEWAWIAFSDAIVTVGDMALFTVQMRACLESRNRGMEDTRKTDH